MKCCSLQNTSFKNKEPRFLIGDLNKFELSDVFFKKEKISLSLALTKHVYLNVFLCLKNY